MQRILFIFIFILTSLRINAQTSPHQPAPPPLNPGYLFTRGMFVNCSDDIVNDVANGNPLGLKSDLISYVTTNYIGYLILRDLENSGVFGNTTLEGALRNMIGDIRNAVPNIQIGICGSGDAFFKSTHFLTPEEIDKDCFNNGHVKDFDAFREIIDPSDNSPSALQRAAITAFFVEAFQFDTDKEIYGAKKNCRKMFDSFYLDFPYWNQTASMGAMQAAFADYIRILSVLQILKCSSKCTRYIDAAFLPTEQFMLQGWTAIDQITDADPLIDRITLPAYTNDYNAPFNLSCKTLHFLSDRFSKSGSTVFIGLSAESPAFHYCNSSNTPQNFLGDYLNGSMTPNGNMYSVEQNFVDYFNDPNYQCPGCHCYTYSDNHYSASNIWGNVLSGVIWSPYSMMRTNNLNRSKPLIQKKEENAIYEIIDVNGRSKAMLQSEDEVQAIFRQLPVGMYIILIRIGDEIKSIKKIIE